jgi:hypothetical protein
MAAQRQTPTANGNSQTQRLWTAKGKERHGKDGKGEKNEGFFAALRMTA